MPATLLYTAMKDRLFGLVSALGLCLLLFACEGDTHNRRSERGDNFVSDPDHLFFMNTRSREYRSFSTREGVDLFRHDDLDGDPELIIRNNWLTDRADLLLRGDVLPPAEVARLRNEIASGADDLELSSDAEREAALEVLADYLRLVGR